MCYACAMDKTEAQWESEFRRSGKDKQFNSYLAYRRLDIALLNLFREVTRPLVPVVERLDTFLRRLV